MVSIFTKENLGNLKCYRHCCLLSFVVFLPTCPFFSNSSATLYLSYTCADTQGDKGFTGATGPPGPEGRPGADGHAGHRGPKVDSYSLHICNIHNCCQRAALYQIVYRLYTCMPVHQLIISLRLIIIGFCL